MAFGDRAEGDPLATLWHPPGELDGGVIHVPGYEILGELGRGAMGVVYKAVDLRLNRLVALKMILAGEYASQLDLARFQSEAEAAARIQHPHIVRIFEVGEHEGRPYMALEYVEGGGLDRQLAGLPMPPRRAAVLAVRLARAMSVAHALQIVHRDLKPANVLMMTEDCPKITDFGLAKLLDREEGKTKTGSILGTPSYMAPEQATGHARKVGPTADVYALGAILYELLTGLPPFQGPTVMATLQKVRDDDPVPPRRLEPGTPRDLETICLKCLEKAPGRRYPDAGALGDDLELFLADEPVRARAPGRPGPLWRWARRSPLAAFLLMSLFLIICGGLIGVSWQWRKAEATRQALARALHAMKVVQEYRDLLSLLKDAETGQRGYLLTEDESYLEPYRDAVRHRDGIFQRTKRWILDHPGEDKRLDEMEALIEAKFRELQRTIDLTMGGDHSASLALVRTGEGKAIMDRLRLIIAEVQKRQDEEIRRLRGYPGMFACNSRYLNGIAFLDVSGLNILSIR